MGEGLPCFCSFTNHRKISNDCTEIRLTSGEPRLISRDLLYGESPHYVPIDMMKNLILAEKVNVVETNRT